MADETYTMAQTMQDSYCRLNPIMCGPELEDTVTEFYQSANATTDGSLELPNFPIV